jgi:hypothetical protein
MTNRDAYFENDGGNASQLTRIAYIKPTGIKEAKALGITFDGIKLPDDIKLYVLHAVDGSVLGYTDSWDTAYGAAIQNELTPVSVH